ncbi:MAG: TetR/AcrR family transcriptional regulator [Pseudomonadota bacterium]
MPAGRPRKHDTRAIQLGIMQCFWRLGFENASLLELEQAAGVDRKQLARDFGNKRGLYLQALDDFAVFAGDRFVAPLEQPDGGLEAIRLVLFRLADLPQLPAGRLGCLICNASREPIAQTDDEVAKRIRVYFLRIEGGYRTALGAAVARGDVAVEPNQHRATARHLFAVHVALLVLARAESPGPVLQDIAERALASVTMGKTQSH